ncbi:MAG: XVIPCD domain-containing protein [Stenotrophomonas sp.]
MQAGHPDHALYQQIREHVTALDAKHGRSFDGTSERMTASLLVLAKGSGLDRVDHVMLSNATPEKGAAHHVFVIQGDPSNPAHQRGVMPTEQAVRTPVEESLQRFEAVSQERHQAQQQDQQLTQAREQQGSQARAMSM